VLVELIGPTGAGKSTLATLLCGHLGGPATATTATDLVMDRPLLRRVHHEQVANLVQDVRGLPHLARTLPRQAEVLRLSARLLLEHAPSRLDLLLNARSVMRRIGMFELARAKAGGRVVLLDIFLHHEPAKRVADHDGRARQLPNGNGDVLHVIGEARPPKPVGPLLAGHR
jgi:hypothetical protein